MKLAAFKNEKGTGQSNEPSQKTFEEYVNSYYWGSFR